MSLHVAPLEFAPSEASNPEQSRHVTFSRRELVSRPDIGKSLLIAVSLYRRAVVQVPKRIDKVVALTFYRFSL